MPAGIKTKLDPIHQAFLEDAIALFEGTRYGHMSPWLYGREGAPWWEAYAENSTAAAEETLLLKRLVKSKPGAITQATEVIEAGPGAPKAVREETSRIVRAAPHAKLYIPIDLSDTFHASTADEFGKNFQDVTVYPRKANFFKRVPIRRLLKNPLLVCMGLTISNLPCNVEEESPHDVLVKALKNLKATAQHKGHLLVSVDAHNDGKDVVANYDSVIVKNFYLSLITRMIHELGLKGARESDFDYRPVWDKKHDLLSHELVIKRPLHIRLGHRSFRLKEGHRLRVNNSFKWPNGFFQEAMEDAGIPPDIKLQTQRRRVTLYLAPNEP
ncbi:MAG: L-histidine N(alpha)-methyltransferase [Proteobacteria bacterium]|nr:L-histidine N(alpha)-methyltransferase [Pseudomonadota bacterium]